MFIRTQACPGCSAEFIVDEPLWESGIELRCPECGTYFVPEGTPRRHTAQEVCRASVPIVIWRPAP
jgi:uncharacterized Zn finger protein